MNSLKSLMLIGSAVALAGCKINASVYIGGDLQSASGTRNCSQDSVCQFEITDTNFTESFTAVPSDGYVFSGWVKGADFLCGGSTNPTCVVSNTGFAGNVHVEAVVESQKMFHIMPIFEFVGIDTDGDGVKDHLDEDDDNDGIFDIYDPYPLDSTLPGDSVTCNGEGQELVFETIDWSQQPGQTVIDIPTGGTASQFMTTDSQTYQGNITLVPTTGNGYVNRRIWISSCPGGYPIAQALNGCESIGTEASIRWTQNSEPRSRSECRLEVNRTYYLNYANENCNVSNCDAFRNTYFQN